MIRINENFLRLNTSYLFSTIAEKISAFEKKHPEKQIIKLGIGDVTMPLPQACIKAFHRGVDEMAEE
ncbi:MAG: LL-diaminopimelate aminotransferase, partial [Thermodesulfobacteriota bacterium]|nr:LL-diaminopimelate aminotransferase [Thermodesulfobacteriota bacterium]